MIFTECPYCDALQSFAWEIGDGSGWFPSRCGSCAKVMWIQAASVGGETISHEDFQSRVMRPGDEGEIEKVAREVGNLSTIEL